MASPIIIPKKSTIADKVPLPEQLEGGEVSVNWADQVWHGKHPSTNAVVPIGAPALHSHDELYSLDKSQHIELQNNGDLTLPNGGTISDSAVAEGSLTFTPPSATNKWTLGIDGSTILPNNTLKGYSFTATNTVTNYIPQAGSFLYDDSPILGLITTEGGAWYIKGPGLVGWKQITQAQDNSGVALILRIGSGNTPLPDGSEFPSGGGNVYTISQYIEFNLKVADKTWIFNKDGDLTLPASGDILDSNGTSVLGLSSGLATDIQIFTTTGSWTKPTGAKVINIQLLAGGGGGGGGFKNVASTNRSGGAGGGGGGFLSANIPAQLLPETPISITIGAGGLGGSGSTNNGVTGGAGVLGGATIFGSGASGEITYIATGGAGGGGGSGAVSAVGFGSLNANSGGQGNIGNGAVGQPSAANSNHFMGGAGGGGAGGINNSNATSTGLNGGRSNLLNLTGGASNGGAGQNNTNAVNGLFAVGSGGGGGNSSRTVNGTSGGNGGFPSSGGGGGGASEAGNGGAGGTGGAGMAIITTYF
jgi:hypothetical protein